jgi:hypothetical protein
MRREFDGADAGTGRPFGWCGPAPPPQHQTKPSSGGSLKSEAAGYFAMLAFLSAYVLSVAGVGPLFQAACNASGAAVAALYLRRKGAIPSVISNLLWLGITIAGLMMR